QIVGYSFNSIGQAPGSGFLLSGGALTTLTVPGASYTQLYGINNVGQIVGFSNKGSFLFSGGTFTMLPVAVGIALGLNDSGQIGGGEGDHGFLLSGGTLTTFDAPRASVTVPTGINNAGQIVGAYADISGQGHGFVLSGANLVTLDVPGSNLTEAFGINDRGEVVGDYKVGYDEYFGFLATPSAAPVPEPSTILLLGIGTLGVIAWARRRLSQSTHTPLAYSAPLPWLS